MEKKDRVDIYIRTGIVGDDGTPLVIGVVGDGLAEDKKAGYFWNSRVYGYLQIERVKEPMHAIRLLLLGSSKGRDYFVPLIVYGSGVSPVAAPHFTYADDAETRCVVQVIRLNRATFQIGDVKVSDEERDGLRALVDYAHSFLTVFPRLEWVPVRFTQNHLSSGEGEKCLGCGR